MLSQCLLLLAEGAYGAYLHYNPKYRIGILKEGKK